MTAGSATTDINASMAQGGSIAGHVTNMTARVGPNPGICVSVFTHGSGFGQPHGQAATDANGLYTIAGLATGGMT